MALNPQVIEFAIALNVIIFFVVACIAIKKRKVANYFSYIELAFRLFALLKPNSRSESTSASMYMLETFAIIFATYCGDRKSFYLTCVVVVIQIFFGVHWIYESPLTVVALIVNLFVLFNFGLISSIVITTLHYIKKLQAKLQFTNQENYKLLQTMSQGLIIVNKPEQESDKCSVMF